MTRPLIGPEDFFAASGLVVVAIAAMASALVVFLAVVGWAGNQIRKQLDAESMRQHVATKYPKGGL